MSEKILYKVVEYGNGESDEAVALVSGFAGKIRDLDQAGRDLANGGRDVLVYEYSPEVLLDGDSNHLPELIDTLNEDFVNRTPEHLRRRFGGVSLGGGVAAGMQKKHLKVERGLYAATGVDVAELIMNHCLFNAMVKSVHGVDIRRVYESKGDTLHSLREKWHDLQNPPDTALTLALGGLDYIVRTQKILPKIKQWHAENRDIRVIHRPWSGHSGTIKWFNRNIDSML